MQDGKWRHANSIEFLLRQWVLWRRWTFYARGESFALKGKNAWESPVHGSSGLYRAFASPIFLLVIGRTSCIRLIHGCSLCAEACAADFFVQPERGIIQSSGSFRNSNLSLPKADINTSPYWNDWDLSSGHSTPFPIVKLSLPDFDLDLEWT